MLIAAPGFIARAKTAEDLMALSRAVLRPRTRVLMGKLLDGQD